MAPRNRADVHRQLARLASELYPLFPSVAASHHLDAAEALANFGLWDAALEEADKAELLAFEDCGSGEGLLERAKELYREASAKGVKR